MNTLNTEFCRVTDKAEMVCEIAQRERIARNAGRRESDREIETLRDNLRLAHSLLSKAISVIDGGKITVQEMTALRMGLEIINGR